MFLGQKWLLKIYFRTFARDCYFICPSKKTSRTSSNFVQSPRIASVNSQEYENNEKISTLLARKQ